jgi:hypothetical protein
MTISKDSIRAIDLSTRSKRRQAASIALELVGRIGSAEWENLGQFPHNLRYSKAFADADYSFECLVDAIVRLGDAY